MATKYFVADPGGTTGWVVWRSPQQFLHGQLEGEHHLRLARILEAEQPSLIICERFDHRNNDFTKLSSLEYIGVVKQYAQKYAVQVVWQGSDQAKGWVTDDKLKHLGYLIVPKTPNRHANDAMRHLVYFLCNNNRAPRPVQHAHLGKLKSLVVPDAIERTGTTE